jgi:Domain of unknown function (DUF6484)
LARTKGRGNGKESAAAAVARELVHAAGAAAVLIGRIAPGSRPDRIAVEFEGNGGTPVPARSTVALDAETLARAARERQGAVLVFEGGDAARPVLLGLLAAPSPSPLIDSAIEETRRSAGAARAAAPAAQRKDDIEARLDGKRVVLEAREEIVLRCGDASITLRRDGKLMVKGAYVETRATGVNRIKGGAVKIN